MNTTRTLAALAVVGVLAGGSVATGASSLITGSKVKDSSLTGADVRNGSLTRADLKAGTLPRGTAGPVGVAGPQGPKGDAGPQGPRGDVTNVQGDSIVGPKGDKGDTGAQGPTGATGARGSFSTFVARHAFGTGFATAYCDSGQRAVLGGYSVGETQGNISVFLTSDGTGANYREGIAISAYQTSGTQPGVSVTAICIS